MAELGNRTLPSPGRTAHPCLWYLGKVSPRGEGRRDWERKAEMLRDAEIQMETDTRRGFRERQRGGCQGGKETEEGGREAEKGGREERDRKSQLLYSWLVIL